MNFNVTRWLPILAALMMGFASCGQGQIQDDVSFSYSSTVQCSIRLDETDGVNRRVSVLLNKGVKESTLESIAQEIVSRSKGRYERTLVLYYLPDMEPGEGAWAMSDTSLEKTVIVFGLSPRMERDVLGTGSGPTEDELVEALAYLKAQLLEANTRFGHHPSMALDLRQKINEVEELLAKKRMEQ